MAYPTDGGLVIGRDKICAVVVTYFPKPACGANLVALSLQVGKLLIVDNGSDPSSCAVVDEVGRNLDAAIVRLGENRGIASALNIGLRFARDHGYRWLATFDQDSRITPGMLAEMGQALARYPKPESVAVVAPRHVDERLTFAVRDRDCEVAGDGWRIIRSTMTSGNLVRVDAAWLVAGFDESLFIDLVDHDFCLKLRRYGFRVLEATSATLLHSLGSMERRWLIFKKVTVTHHPAIRRYYISRNRLVVWRRYWKQEPLWVLRDMRRFVFESVYVVLFEKQVCEKLRMMRRGIRDAIRHRSGPFRAAG